MGSSPEYYNGVTGEVDDYQLNINDDTPLYILAVEHTFQITDDRSFLDEMYPSVEKLRITLFLRRTSVASILQIKRRGRLWHLRLAEYNPKLRHKRSGYRS